jgi:hypothetical protein
MIDLVLTVVVAVLERYDLVDARRDMATGAPRAVRGRLVGVPPVQRRRPITSALFGIYRWGWGFSTSQDFNGDNRAHRVLRRVLDSRHGAALARRSVRLPAASNELPALMGSAPPPAPPATGTGVVTFLMGWLKLPGVRKLSYRLQGVQPTLAGRKGSTIADRALGNARQMLADSL